MAALYTLFIVLIFYHTSVYSKSIEDVIGHNSSPKQDTGHKDSLTVLFPTSSPNKKLRDDNPHHKLVLVVCSGFRYDYLDKSHSAGFHTPTLDKLKKQGVSTDHLINVYPTTTYPNVWSLVTGMGVERHGIVHDNFYDPVLRDVFNGIHTPYNRFYNNGTWNGGGHPIWLTNQQQGQHTVVAVLPGSRVSIDGARPSYSMPVNHSIPWKERVNFVVDHMTHGDGAANLGIIYLEEPDEGGHGDGPESETVFRNIEKIDETLGDMLHLFTDKDLEDEVNIIITGDHGNTGFKAFEDLDRYVYPSYYDFHGSHTAPILIPRESRDADFEKGLKSMPHGKLWKKTELPASLHYTYNRRIAPYVLLMDEGYVAGSAYLHGNITQDKGLHGYSTDVSSMRPFFLASGPSFQQNAKSMPFHIIDIYPLMCHLLGLVPHDHDGNISNIQHILADEEFYDNSTKADTPMLNSNMTDSGHEDAKKLYYLPMLYISLVVSTIGALITTVCYFKVCRYKSWPSCSPGQQLYTMLGVQPPPPGDEEDEKKREMQRLLSKSDLKSATLTDTESEEEH